MTIRPMPHAGVSATRGGLLDWPAEGDPRPGTTGADGGRPVL